MKKYILIEVDKYFGSSLKLYTKKPFNSKAEAVDALLNKYWKQYALELKAYSEEDYKVFVKRLNAGLRGRGYFYDDNLRTVLHLEEIEV